MCASIRYRSSEAESGNTILFSLLLVTLIIGLSFAHFASVQKNSLQARFLNDLGKLRRYAESGVNMAVLKMNEGTADAGKVGTALWKDYNDVGRDGKAGTKDEGEGDGIPTPGEPNLASSPIGPSAEGIGLLVSTSDTAWPNVKKIVATASDAENYATVEVYARGDVMSIPGVGAVYIEPGSALDLNGNAFLIDGHDTNPNGTPGSGTSVYGISTPTGSPAGSNQKALVDQVPLKRVDQVTGMGADPSIGEGGAVDFDGLFNSFKNSSNLTLYPGTYNDVSWGDDSKNSYQVTYLQGDAHLTGKGKGAGVLVVDGMLTLSGSFDFVGIILVRGDVKITGGGTGIHVYGSMMLKETLTAVDTSGDTTEVTISGTSDLRFSSQAIAKAQTLLRPSYTVLYWKMLH